MTTIIIDNKPYDVRAEQNVLEAAIAAGLDLPYFCWHPALGSVGSCRQCAVMQFANDQDTKGRMVMACMTPVKDGARFSIGNETCQGFRKSVIEWLMINHPHDCPVCDEGGECHLQDMTLMTGHNYRRHRFLKRTYTNQNLGPFINHEMNRCITCYRCVRYYQDVAGGSDLSAFASSGRVYFGRFTEGSLENPFSGNLTEVCPTGVFTDKVYHQHYTRKWDLETAPSVCQLCSVGCTIAPGARAGILRRVQNRYHHDINGFFLCDKGRFGHDFVNAPERILAPHIKGKSSVSMADAMTEASAIIKKGATIGIGSPRASLEANWALKQLVGADNFYDGVPVAHANYTNAVLQVLQTNAISVASLRDIRSSDCIVIIGEDITHTAPMAALSVRQAAKAYKESLSHSMIDVAAWQDAAVKTFSDNVDMPLFIAASSTTELDDIAKEYCLVHPADLPALTDTLCQAVTGTPCESDWAAWITACAQALKHAKKPVIISGSSQKNVHLLLALVRLYQAVDQDKDKSPQLFLALEEANSLGLAMLRPRSMQELLHTLENKSIDNALVLENDLAWRLSEKSFSTLTKSIPNIIALDSLSTETTKRASMVLPALSFAESTGSLVSCEGRLQKYLSVYKNRDDLMSSFHLLMSLKNPSQVTTIDDIQSQLAADLQIPTAAFDALYHADLKIMGKGIARQTPQASGRTALYANVSIHEQKPPQDIDSPLVYSMEGARKKIPLPLIASYSEPGWNSVQSEFKKDLGIFHPSHDKPGGVRLFEKTKANANVTLAKGDSIEKTSFPKVFIMPGYNLFASMERARFAKAVASRIPLIEARVSKIDAQAQNLPANFNVIVETSIGKLAMPAKVCDIPAGVVVLPHGLIDPEIFLSYAHIRVVNEECV